VIAGEYTLRNAIDKYYQQSDAQLQTLLKDIEAADDLEVVEEQTDEDVKAQDLADDAPVVKLINGLLTDAVKRGRRTSTSSRSSTRCGCATGWMGRCTR